MALYQWRTKGKIRRTVKCLIGIAKLCYLAQSRHDPIHAIIRKATNPSDNASHFKTEIRVQWEQSLLIYLTRLRTASGHSRSLVKTPLLGSDKIWRANREIWVFLCHGNCLAKIDKAAPMRPALPCHGGAFRAPTTDLPASAVTTAPAKPQCSQRWLHIPVPTGSKARSYHGAVNYRSKISRT